MSSVYKYLPPERASYFDDALLRFTPPGALNDPFECFPALIDEVVKQALEYLETKVFARDSVGNDRGERRKMERTRKKEIAQKIQALKNDPDLFAQGIHDYAAESINGRLGILSLSRRWDSSLMWSHYTNCHQGFCIGFDRNHSFFADSARPRSDFRPVIYSHRRPTLTRMRTSPDDNKIILSTKSKDWEYEEEERVIALLANADKVISALPHNISLFKVPHDAVTEIVLGMRSSKDLRKCAQVIARKFDVPLYLAEPSKTDFDVTRQAIKD